MKHWLVITPEYGTVIPVLDFGEGPVEYGCDVIEIEAVNRYTAITLGVKEMLRPDARMHAHQKYQWCKDTRADGCCPYAGVWAEEIKEIIKYEQEELDMTL